MNRPPGSKNKNLDHPVLKKLPPALQAEILGRAELRQASAGSLLFSQDDPGDGFFMIKSGSIRIYRNKEGIETELAVLGPGDSFGEMALLNGAPRSASARVLDAAELLFLSKADFDAVLRGYPMMALILIKQMASWILTNDRMIEREQARHYRPPRLAVVDFIILLLLSGFCALTFNHSNPNGIPLFPKIERHEGVAFISPEAAAAEHRRGTARFVDARPPESYDGEHIQGAVNIPLTVFDIMYMIGLSDADKAEKIIVYGRNISRLYDLSLANKLALRGHKNLAVLEGGLSAWKKKGYPTAP